ncbi:hypothetical protein BKA70DRAFT_1224265 [Coprinopsis sp. MPI-PUGE-AT-0042]|nr:hypothetical protein BKA70DRAFT_1224265 [Coprinopsis sp. MPI-PUGE-AT-0042]
MGVASSKATATPGPALTPSEKSAAADASVEQWLKQLEDQSNPMRLNIAHLFSLAVYESVDINMNYDYLGEHLRMVCTPDHWLEKMLQTPFLNGETLITWTICHLPEALLLHTPLDTIPSVLSVQLGCIKSWQKIPSLTDAMSVACCIRNTNALFQLLNPYRNSTSSGSLVYSVERYGMGPETFQFTINNFPMHMLVDKRIDMRFISGSRLYSIGFAIGKRGEWNFFYDVVQDRSGERSYTRTIHVDLERFGGNGKGSSIFKAQVSSGSWTTGERVGGDASRLKNAMNSGLLSARGRKPRVGRLKVICVNASSIRAILGWNHGWVPLRLYESLEMANRWNPLPPFSLCLYGNGDFRTRARGVTIEIRAPLSEAPTRLADVPSVDQHWPTQLLNRTDPLRKDVISAICAALPTAKEGYESAGHVLPEKLLAICGSDAKLKLMLQTPFMDGQCPISWTILNFPDNLLGAEDPKVIPPILSMLLKCYGAPTAQLTHSIHSACCIRNSHELLQLLDLHLAGETNSLNTPITLKRCASGWLNANSDYEFVIPNFQEKMLLEGRIDMRFIHSARLYNVGFAIRDPGGWVFFYRILLDHNTMGTEYPGEIHAELLCSNGSAKGLLLSASLEGNISRDSNEQSTGVAVLRNA